VVVKGVTHRQRQALATKTQVAAAARKLFAEHGYVSTTIAAIAAEADIPAPTIYSAFRTKGAILWRISQEAMSTLDVDEVHDAARTHPDPGAGLRMAAALQRRQYEIMLDVVLIQLEAARTDPEIAEINARILGDRERSFRAHLEAIAPHLHGTVDEALDICITLLQPEVYRSLVAERGWSPERFEQWLGDALVRECLAG
jgi:AcrR family transcriptional regulator